MHTPTDGTSSSPTDTARALYAALAAGQHGEDLRPLFTEDATTLEHPNLLKPKGGTADLPAMLSGSSTGAQLLNFQRYEVLSAVDHGPLAILRVHWTAEVRNAVGPLKAGQRLSAHLAQFITCRDGRIASIETYDCYDPLTDGPA